MKGLGFTGFTYANKSTKSVRNYKHKTRTADIVVCFKEKLTRARAEVTNHCHHHALIAFMRRLNAVLNSYISSLLGH